MPAGSVGGGSPFGGGSAVAGIAAGVAAGFDRCESGAMDAAVVFVASVGEAGVEALSAGYQVSASAAGV
jgi:hypothetical protein